MKSAEIQKLLDLPVDERMELAQILWESVDPEDEARFLSIPDWQRRILDERLADLESNPNDEQTWEEVKAELWPHS
jgi:putative addiction module component (TIGR02574 family)